MKRKKPTTLLAYSEPLAIPTIPTSGMAEIGLIASIVQIAGIGAKVSITLFQIASALGSAGYEVRFVAADISALSLVLTHLSALFEGGNRQRAKESRLLELLSCSVEAPLMTLKSS
jgi:hypothetical protein